MGLGMRLVLLRPRRNRCAPFSSFLMAAPCRACVRSRSRVKNYSFYISGTQELVKRGEVMCCIIRLPQPEARTVRELKTEALGRILEAVSPALAAELDRIVGETREELQRDFQQ